MLDAFSKMGQDLRFTANNQDMYFQLCKKKIKIKKKIYIYTSDVSDVAIGKRVAEINDFENLGLICSG